MSDSNQAPRPNLPSLSATTKLTPLSGNPPPIGSTSPVQGIKLPPISFLSNNSSSPNNSQSPILPQQHLQSESQSQSHSQVQVSPSLYPRPRFSSILSNESKDSQYPSQLPHQQQSPVLQAISQQQTPILASSSGSSPSTGSFVNYPPQPTSASSNSLQPLSQSISQQQTFTSSTTTQLPQSQGSQTQSQISAVQYKQEITKPDFKEESDEAIIKYYEDKYGFKDFTQEEKHDILQHEKRARIEKSKNPNYKTFLCYSIIKRLNAIPPAGQSQGNVLTTDNNLLNITKSSEEKPEEHGKPNSFVKREVKINNDDVLEFASKFPRKYLGSVIYNATPTKETYKQLPLFKDIKVTPEESTKIVPLLPELREHINSIVTVRIPSFQIIDLLNNENFIKRKIWGTDIYTDDSDVLLVLKHNGFLPTQDSDVEQLIPSEGAVKSTPGNKDNNQNVAQNVSNFKHFLNIIGGDIHVDLIILPPLTSYKGVYRNGINSRDWLTGHDGVSFALYGVRYGDKNSAIDSSNDIAIKKRKLKELYEMENDPEDQYEKPTKSWKLSYKAWRAVKQQIELGKDKSKTLSEENGKKVDKEDDKVRSEDKKSEDSDPLADTAGAKSGEERTKTNEGES